MRRIASYLFLFLLVFLIVGCNAKSKDEPSLPEIELKDEECAITGKVTSNGSAIENAIIEIRNTSYLAKTDSTGNFVLIIEKTENTLKLEVSKTGYKQKNIDISNDMFVDGVANVNVELLSNTIIITGVVKDESGTPLSNVLVSVEGLNGSTKTNKNGEYSLEVERLSGYELVFYKDFYEITSVTIEDVGSGNTIYKDVALKDLKIVISGNVSNNYEGSIAGAFVSIIGTEYFAITDENGNYEITDIELENMDFEISVSKDGYFNSVYPSDRADNLELIKDYTKLPQVGEEHKFDAYVTKSSEGFYFKFYVDSFTLGSGSKEEKVQIFINPGEFTEDNRMKGSHVAEIALCSNEDIVVVVNYINGDPEYITDFNREKEVIYESIKLDDGRTELNLFFKYSLFKDYFADEFSINSNSVIGLNITSWSDFLDKPAEGWILEELPGVDGKAWVDHNNPQDWPRLSSDGTYLYENSNNSAIEMFERVVSGVVSSDGIPVEGVLVQNTSLGISTYTDSNGEYCIVIPKEKFYLENINLLFSKEGYVDVVHLITDFVDKSTTKDVELLSGENKVSVTGKVVDTNREQLVDVVISVKGTDYVTYSDEKGLFELIGLECSLPYTLVLKKEGYESLEIEINEYTVSLTGLTLMKEPIYLGSLGESEYKVTVSVEQKQLTIKYVSSKIGADATEIIQYLNFGTSGIYEVRFKKGWTGVWSWNNLDWTNWDDRIQMPVYSIVGNNLIITQTIDLTYFEDLGVDVSNLKMSMCENFENYLNYKDELILNLDNRNSWAQIIGENTSGEDKIYENVYIGTFGVSNVEAYATLSGNLLTMRYEAVSVPGEINQFFIFNTDVVYEVRFNQAGWTGIWNWTKVDWEGWNGKIGIPSYSTVNGKYIMTQVIDLTYFSDLGLDITSIKFNAGENLRGETHLIYNGNRIDFNNHSTWMNLLDVIFGKEVILPGLPIEPAVEEIYLGTFGTSNIEAYATLDGNTLTMRYEADSVPGQINQFFIFNNDVVYEVRFDQTGWTGIWNWTKVDWELWTEKIANPSYATVDGKYVMTQVIDLTYFSDLGLDISSIKFDAGEDLLGETHLIYNGNRIDFNNHSTWVILR